MCAPMFATNALDHQVLSNFKMSCGCVTSIPSSTHRNLFVEESCIIDIGIATTGDKAQGVDHEHLSKVWLINLKVAQRTIEITTQLKQ